MHDYQCFSIPEHGHTGSVQVELSDTDPFGRVRLSTILKWFQNLSSRHSARIGLPVTRLRKASLTWVVSRYEIHIKRLPEWQETLDTGTWRSKGHGLFAPRQFLVADGAKEVVIAATSRFVLLDLTTGRPVSPWERFPEYPVAEKTAVESGFPRIPGCGNPHWEGQVLVRRADMDLNGHVNNSVYPDWSLEPLPEDRGKTSFPGCVEILFKGSALYGDTVHVGVMPDPDDSQVTIHSLRRDGDDTELTRVRIRWQRF